MSQRHLHAVLIVSSAKLVAIAVVEGIDVESKGKKSAKTEFDGEFEVRAGVR